MPVSAAAAVPAAVLADLEIGEPEARVEAGAPAPAGKAPLVVDAGRADPGDPGLAARILASAESALPPHGRLLITGARTASGGSLARLRNGLWPVFHVHAAYRFAGGRVERLGFGALRNEAEAPAGEGFVLAALHRATALSPQVTIEKFDKNAAGWNGVPGAPDYAHFRWMRRLVALCARPRRGESVLDAGCGAGWVGIEAAKLGARAAAFDPSPEMVRHARENAASEGVTLDARVGFGERPPFDEPFDLVLNSGVISFAPDPEDFLSGLDRLVRPGGRLVIGDLNPLSSGMARRRREKPVLPVREMNALPREHVASLLEKRGYRVDWRRYYQLTWPVPEAIHRSKSRALQALLLACNRAFSATDAIVGSPMAGRFDSWILGTTKPG